MPRGGPREGAGRPITADSGVSSIRLSPELRAALDAASVADPAKPGRSELILRIVTGWLAEHGFMETTGEALPDDEDATRRQQVKVDASRRTAREGADEAADVAMRGIDATAEEKARRRKVLTDVPAAVTKARRDRRVR